MRGVEEIIFQTLVMGRIYALRRAWPAEPQAFICLTLAACARRAFRRRHLSAIAARGVCRGIYLTPPGAQRRAAEVALQQAQEPADFGCGDLG
jgi:hypothetical protein